MPAPHRQVEPVEGPLLAVALDQAAGLDRQVVSVARHVVPSRVGADAIRMRRRAPRCPASRSGTALRTTYGVETIRYAVPGFNRRRGHAPPPSRSCIMSTCHRRGRARSRSAARAGTPTRWVAATIAGGTASDGRRSCPSTARNAPTPNHHRSAALAARRRSRVARRRRPRRGGRPDRHGRGHGRGASRRRPRLHGRAGRRPRGSVRAACSRPPRPGASPTGWWRAIRRGPPAGPRAGRRTRPALAARRLLRLGRTHLRHCELRLRRTTAPGRSPGRQLVPGAGGDRRGSPVPRAGLRRRAARGQGPRDPGRALHRRGVRGGPAADRQRARRGRRSGPGCGL